MATFSKVNDFVENLAHGVFDFSTHTLRVALSNLAPGSETPNPATTGNGVLANVTEIVYTNCSTRAITLSSSAESGGTYSLTLNDLVLTASGGTVGPFQYVYVYDDNPTSPADPLIGYYNHGSAVTLQSGETYTIDFGADAGSTGVLLTIA